MSSSAVATAPAPASKMVTIKMIPKLGKNDGVSVEMPAEIAEIFQTAVTFSSSSGISFTKKISDLSDDEFTSYLSDLNRRSILTGVFGVDAEGKPFITANELVILTVLHGWNFSTFEWINGIKANKPVWERTFKAPKPSFLPQHVLVAEKILSGEIQPLIKMDSEASVHFLTLVDLAVQLRELKVCRDAFATIPVSAHPSEKKKTEIGADGVRKEISTEAVNRPLEKEFKPNEYENSKNDLPRHRVREEKDKDGKVTKVIALFDLEGASDIYVRSVLTGVFGFVPSSDKLGQKDHKDLLTTCLKFLCGIDAIIRDASLPMLSDGTSGRSKIYMISDETYRVARAFWVVMGALLIGSLTPEILKDVNEALTLNDVRNMLKTISRFYSYYAQALKAADDAFNSLLCPDGSRKEAWVKGLYCYSVINCETNPELQMEVEH